MSVARPEVLVRFLRTEVFRDEDVAADARRILGAEEREMLARVYTPEARRGTLAAHALARTMLAERAVADPARLPVCAASPGRLRVKRPGAPDLYASLAHADGIALCAVAESWEVGADLASLRSVGWEALLAAEGSCSARERAALCALESRERADHLLALRTLKGAVARAMGRSDHLPLARMTADEDDERLLGVSFESDGRGPIGFPGALACLRLTADHLAAVALLAPPWAGFHLHVEELSARARVRAARAGARARAIRRPGRRLRPPRSRSTPTQAPP